MRRYAGARDLARHLAAWVGAVLVGIIGFSAPPGLAAPREADAAVPSAPYILGLPEQRPLPIEARFHLHDVNDINDEEETFELAGVLTLKWQDPRLAFDPAEAGVDEKIVSGEFQFNEISPSWYPQVFLVNEAGLFQTSAVMQRILPDGTSTLVQSINAVAEVDLDLRLYPLDNQRLEAVFEIFGFDRDEIVLQVGSEVTSDQIRIPQWSLLELSLSVRDQPAPYAGATSVASALVLSVDVRRESWYARRLIVSPLVLIVLLSFSVFWMDESASLSDRLGVSFIGILTGVAYQMVISDQLPHISYFTLIHGFVGWSFITMCTTVLANVVIVGRYRDGDHAGGHRLGRMFRWAFPLGYIAVNLSMLTFEYVIS